MINKDQCSIPSYSLIYSSFLTTTEALSLITSHNDTQAKGDQINESV